MTRQEVEVCLHDKLSGALNRTLAQETEATFQIDQSDGAESAQLFRMIKLIILDLSHLIRQD